MKFILHSDIDERSIRENLGRPDYSYYFVLKAFRPAIERLGSIILVKNPENELDEIYRDCAERGEPCLFISFAPPHKTLIGHRCPTVVVFAWEFSTIPDEAWDDDPRNDWRFVFAHHGRAISLSSYSARAVKSAMGDEFPVAAVAAPVWDRFAGLRDRNGRAPVPREREIRFDGALVDSRTAGLSPEYLLSPKLPLGARPHPGQFLVPVPAPAPASAPVEIRKTLRYRVGVTKFHALEWYREAIRDLLPRLLVWLLSRLGRLSYRSYRLAFGLARHLRQGDAPTIKGNSDSELEAPPDVGPPDTASPSDAVQGAIDRPETKPSPPPFVWHPAGLGQGGVGRRVSLDGVVYTSVFNPKDGRKNWTDIVTAFCWAFRDVEDATLVVKIVHHDIAAWYDSFIEMLSQLSPFKCRVVALHGFLEHEQYEELIVATTYYVNASCCEGLCLPLMEFMSCGKPAIAPNHTAMEDYIDTASAFVVGSSLEHNVWPHDPRDLFRTMRYRIDWESLFQAYRDSYHVARQNPELYARMAECASAKMRDYCGDDAIANQLEAFFESSGAPDAIEPGLEHAAYSGQQSLEPLDAVFVSEASII